jgi:hypothetical protein
MRRRVGTSLYAGVLLAVLGAITFVTGQPFVFPSLGPSAFTLAADRQGGARGFYRVVGGHLVGAVAGFLAYAIVVPGVVVTSTPAALSVDGARLAASGVLSVVATSWGMVAADAVHPPACATTLIVSLGLLSTPLEVAIIVASVVVLVAVHEGMLSVVGAVADVDADADAADDRA